MASYDSIMGQQVALSRKIPRKEDEVPPWEGAAPGATFNVPASSVPPEVAGAYTNNPDGTVTLPAGVMPAYKGGGAVTPGPTAPVQTDTEVPEQAPTNSPMMVPQSTGTYVPARLAVTAQTTQKGFEDPASMAKIAEGQKLEEETIKAAALQGQAKAVEQAGFSAAMADQQEQFAVAKKAREYDREQKVAAAMAPMNALADELASGKVDPSRYLQNQSTGAKLATMLSVVLGAGAAQRINGRNVGLDMMNDAIARDVDAQKASFDMKRGALAAKQSLYGQMLQNFGREDIAADATQLALMKGYEAKIGAVAAKYAGTEAGNRANMLLAQSLKNSGELTLKIKDATRDHTTVKEQLTGGGYVGGSGGGGGGGGPAIDVGDPSELDEETFVDEGNGKGFLVGSKEQKVKIQASSAAVKDIQGLLAKAIAIRSKFDGLDLLNPLNAPALIKAKLALKQIQSQLNSKVTVFEGQGAMSEGDKKNTIEATQDVSELSPGVSERLQAASDMYGSVHQNRVAEAGGRRVIYGTGMVGRKGKTPPHQARVGRLTGESTADKQAPAEQVKVQPIKAGK